jgi:membrane-associated phospholipid phosphatase
VIGLLDVVAHGDALLSDAVADVRWGPLTTLFVAASLWPVKGALICAVGAIGDVCSRRFLLPSAVCAAAAGGIAAAATALVKDVFDRARPPVADPEFLAAVSVPGSPSFPSGHASTAFAAATVIALFHPRLRIPVLAIAALVAASRVYLGVHFTVDVLVGAGLGAALGAALVVAARRFEPLFARV